MEAEKRGTRRKRRVGENTEDAVYRITQQQGEYKRLRMTEVSIPILPIEIWTHILGMLDLPTALRLKPTSTAFQSIIYRTQGIKPTNIVLETSALQRIWYPNYWIYPLKRSRILLVDRPNLDLKKRQSAYVMKPPYGANDLEASIPLGGSDESSPRARFQVAAINEATWLVRGGNQATRILSFNPDLPVDDRLRFHPVTDYYPEGSKLKDLPAVLKASDIPEDLRTLSVGKILTKEWDEVPEMLPGVGSVLWIQHVHMLVTLHAVYYLGPILDRIVSGRSVIMDQTIESAGFGMLLIQLIHKDKTLSYVDDPILHQEGIVFRYIRQTSELEPVLSIRYPEKATNINAAFLLKRYILITPNLFLRDTSSPPSYGQIYLYDLHSPSVDSIHVFRIPRAPETPLSYLHASGSTVVAFYRSEYQYHRYITHIAFYNLVTGVFLIEDISDLRITKTVATSKDFIFTTENSYLLWFEVLKLPKYNIGLTT